MAFRFAEWLREVSRRHENVERMEHAAAVLPGRKRPRDPEVEEFLRKRGAPEELMEPEREQDG